MSNASVSPFLHIVIRASAGSGKTFQLSNRYLRLLFSGVPVDTILATTFTRKAAGEILDRILQRLGQAALDSEKRKDLSKTLFDNADTLSEQQVFSVLNNVAKNLHRLRVATLDSFFIKLAGSFSPELGLPISWTITDEIENRQILERAVSLVLNHTRTDDAVQLMYLMFKGESKRSVSEQLNSVAADMIDLFQESSRDAWSLLLHRSQNLFKENLSEEHLQRLTDQLAQAELPKNKNGSTNKNFANGMNATLNAIRGKNWKVFFEKGLAPKIVDGSFTYCRIKIEGEILSGFQRLVQHAKSQILLQIAMQTGATGEALDRIALVFNGLKEYRSVFRFEDITRRLAGQALKKCQGQIAHRLDSEIRHLLLDEFQDTSSDQWNILRPFALSITGNSALLPISTLPVSKDHLSNKIVQTSGLLEEQPDVFCPDLENFWGETEQGIEETAADSFFPSSDMSGNLNNGLDGSFSDHYLNNNDDSIKNQNTQNKSVRKSEDVLAPQLKNNFDSVAELDGINQDGIKIAPMTSFFCVGDVKQAIYGWRGGVADIFDTIENDLPNLMQEGLNRNWRSSPVIIDVVNKVFGNLSRNELLSQELPIDHGDSYEYRRFNAFRTAVKNWDKRFVLHQAAEKNLELSGYCALELAPQYIPDKTETENSVTLEKQLEKWKDIDACRQKHTKKKTENYFNSGFNSDVDAEFDSDSDDPDFYADSDDAESSENTENGNQKKTTFRYIIQRIVELHQASPDRSLGVLVRTNKMIGMIIRALKRRGIDASEEGGVPLTDSAAVIAVLSLLRLADHPGDLVARFHLANIAPISKEWGITPDNYQSDMIALRISRTIRQEAITWGLGKTLNRWSELLTPLCGERDQERLASLLELAYLYDAKREIRLDGFIDLVQETRIESPGAASVRVMSIHKSKGLEFDRVVLPELEMKLDGLPPKVLVHRQSPTAPVDAVIRYVGKAEQIVLPDDFKKMFESYWTSALEETLCVLYVAMTRAVRELIMIVSPSKNNQTTSLILANLLRFALCDLVDDLHENCDETDDEKTESFTEKSCPVILFESGNKNWDQLDISLENLAESKELLGSDDLSHSKKISEPEEYIDVNELSDDSEKRIISSSFNSNSGQNANETAHFQEKTESQRTFNSSSETSHIIGGMNVKERLFADFDVSGSDNIFLEGQKKRPSQHLGQILSNPYKQFFGTAVHACFEKLEWLEQGLPSQEELRKHLIRTVPESELADQAIQTFYRFCQEEPLASLLSQSVFQTAQRSFSKNVFDLKYISDQEDEIFDKKNNISDLLTQKNETSDERREKNADLMISAVAVNSPKIQRFLSDCPSFQLSWKVETEKRFLTTFSDHQLMKGSMDRLVLLMSDNQTLGAEIIDFKTTQFLTDNQKKEHQMQLNDYKRAVMNLFSLSASQVSLVLAYPFLNQIFRFY